MRRLGPALALVAAIAVAAGCAGPDGQRAQELLAQSDRALAEVESFRIAARIWMETPVGDFTFVVRGGVSTKSDAAFMSMSSPDVPEFPEMTVIARGNTVWIKEGRRWTRMPVPESEPLALDGLQLTPFVKNVVVSEGHVVGGEPAVKITGVFDTSAFLNDILTAELEGASVPGGMLDGLTESFEDTRVVIFLSEVTFLPLRMLVDISAEEDGEQVEMHLDFALLDINEPIKIPRPRG